MFEQALRMVIVATFGQDELRILLGEERDCAQWPASMACALANAMMESESTWERIAPLLDRHLKPTHESAEEDIESLCDWLEHYRDAREHGLGGATELWSLLRRKEPALAIPIGRLAEETWVRWTYLAKQAS